MWPRCKFVDTAREVVVLYCIYMKQFVLSWGYLNNNDDSPTLEIDRFRSFFNMHKVGEKQ